MRDQPHRSAALVPEAASDRSRLARGRLPNLILAGIGKAGTTSLFWYLSQHPDICASRVKEPRFFLALSQADAGADGVLPPLDGYAALFDQCASEQYAMEATPHYFHGGRRLIEGLNETLPDPRIILTLRNPVDRVWSVFKFGKSMMTVPREMPFEEYLAACERLYRDDAPRPATGRAYWSVRGGVYADYLPDWLDGVPDDRLKIVFFERFAPDPAAAVKELCDWLDLDASCVDSFELSVENRSIGYRNPVLHRLALALNGERLLRNRRRLKAPLRRVYEAVNGSATHEQMPPASRARLEEIFAPSNARVAARLVERGYTDLPAWLARVAPGSASSSAS